ncbi:putative cytokinetic ring protein SteA [Alkalihalobacillus sp. FSL W8-0930]
MTQTIQGQAFEGKRTKELLHRVPDHAVLLLWHEDLDSVTTDAILEKKVKAVVNRRQSMTGTYEHDNIIRLLSAGVTVCDVTEWSEWEGVLNGATICIRDHNLLLKHQNEYKELAKVDFYTLEKVHLLNEKAKAYFPSMFEAFIENTLHHAKSNLADFLDPMKLPAAFQELKHQQVFIVARNGKYKHDVKAMKRWILLTNPFIVAIDGAADGLLDLGLVPHFIIGDMDSISTSALQCGASLICHSFTNGESPGRARVSSLGLESHCVDFIGTSEDVAIRAMHEAGVEHMYLIGCRFGIKEFMEKQRQGMGSTILARMESGDRMTDLKGIHRLFEGTSFVSQVKRMRHELRAEAKELQKMVGRGYRLFVRKGEFRHD